MRPEDIVRSGPNQYICKEGILKDIAYYLDGFHSPVVVTGHKSYQAFLNYTNLPPHVRVIQSDRYSSDTAVNSIAAGASQADVIIGIGGGVILDTAKSVADRLNIEVITIPTVVGTCAASTPLSVIYDDNGSFIRVDYHKRSSYLTLVDPEFLLSSPADYFKSGIGDTLAKWYEAEAIIRNNINNDLFSIMVQTGLNNSSFIKAILLEEGKNAIQSLVTKTISPSFTKILEAVITLAGTVGGYGGRYGRMAGAHAIHNGLSFIEETHSILHGQKVAYGILVQLILENRTEEVQDLLPFYKDLGFPTNFEDLGITHHQEQAMKLIAAHAIKPEESLQLLGSYSDRGIIEAIKQLESLLIKK
ncbi:iron-containing alcohol dehydrogenase family protein [Bacillus sp. ISL-40]|uniref:iron-containing alcohol dehydrogenase family protein n=1 Tax=unclassified Bacillus (in: firmicutes) TaxID=185979 RepID=UPI001BEA0FC9|nr:MULTISPECIES: iron-containing alcohol dehydrogenase family protein [unclassified Bacillus (in: firmicutes)]MBT2696859.1 iron-containing alcohol dehydrogenase family protein [Bacillus sp. ISL-40]MBT2742537.1 iron-containing alcohol dehydrogenase family protein [Bacillus sp. ISL-77]